MSAQATVQTQSIAKPTITPVASGLLQRACACGQHASNSSGECEACKRKRQGLLQRAAIQSSSRIIQTKLAVNKPGDEYEQEADQIADQVTSAPAHGITRCTLPRIQRFTRQPNSELDIAPASVDQALASPGSPLEPSLRQDMEQRFDYDFSQVRVHSGPAAEQSARDVNANAYTVGHNVVFGSGRFIAGTHEGRRLIAHELTHVVQQSGDTPALQRFVDCQNFRRPSRQMSLEDCPQREPGEARIARRDPS